MTMNLTCTQVSALLSFYLDNRLSDQLKQFVEAHLAVCPNCRNKKEALASILESLREAHSRLSVSEKDNIESNDKVKDDLNSVLIANLSAYIDNELDDSENIKVKKNIISNSKAREELETMFKVKNALKKSFDSTKNECKEDYSKLILRRIDIQEEIYGQDSFPKVVALFIVVFAVFSISAVILFGV